MSPRRSYPPRIAIAVAIALLVAVAAAAVAAVALLSEDHPEEFTLNYTDANVRIEEGGIGPRSRLGDPGSGTALSIPLFEEAKEEVGTLNATCIFTQGQGKKVECLGTATIPDGSLVLDGPLLAGGTVSPGAVIGGTGKYEGAYGSFEAVGGEGFGVRRYTIEVKVP